MRRTASIMMCGMVLALSGAVFAQNASKLSATLVGTGEIPAVSTPATATVWRLFSIHTVRRAPPAIGRVRITTRPRRLHSKRRESDHPLRTRKAGRRPRIAGARADRSRRQRARTSDFAAVLQA